MAGVATLVLASRDCVSALSLICGSTSAIVVWLRLSLNKGRTSLIAHPTDLLVQSATSERKDRGAVPNERVVKRSLRVFDVTAWS